MATEFNSKELSEKYSEGVLAEELSLKPIITELISNSKNKLAVDLGCGDGRYSRIFAEKGANVIAIDLSEYQLEIAKEKSSHPNITYQLGDGSEIEVKGGSADIVLMNLVVPDIENKEKLEKTFKEISRILKTDGRAIISTLHPLYLSPEQDDSDKSVGFEKEKYFIEEYLYKGEAITTKGSKITFNETHFSLTFISKKLKESGLLISQIIESKAVPEKGIFLPKYLIFECVKQGKHS